MLMVKMVHSPDQRSYSLRYPTNQNSMDREISTNLKNFLQGIKFKM